VEREVHSSRALVLTKVLGLGICEPYQPKKGSALRATGENPKEQLIRNRPTSTIFTIQQIDNNKCESYDPQTPESSARVILRLSRFFEREISTTRTRTKLIGVCHFRIR
jgi:hypothetical protein